MSGVITDRVIVLTDMMHDVGGAISISRRGRILRVVRVFLARRYAHHRLYIPVLNSFLVA